MTNFQKIALQSRISSYTPKKKYPPDRDFRSRFLTRLVDLSTEALVLEKKCISID